MAASFACHKCLIRSSHFHNKHKHPLGATRADSPKSFGTTPMVSGQCINSSLTQNKKTLQKLRGEERKYKRVVKACALYQDVDLDTNMPVSVDLEPITSEEQFDQVLAQAQQRSEPIIIDWMATWCRKCIYLKPKLEKLAAEFYPRVRFYYVNVNAVPQALVNRANVAVSFSNKKMPTIQLWKDGKKQAEVIGGHSKAWLVVDETREMIENSEATDMT